MAWKDIQETKRAPVLEKPVKLIPRYSLIGMALRDHPEAGVAKAKPESFLFRRRQAQALGMELVEGRAIGSYEDNCTKREGGRG
jgi:hypothetical protein